ncbi:hypothetical protein, conserved [Trypanosoma brucei gambiense DAL972]|uniref:Uncharacterized protein n=1 Tax=Trypanosoma brucei gambiense (strain MHOM/CI/86/DAL972) TaxID=679716 RepID=C9ZMG7_TRYB9|nr:hypothetical protein, conserved [Trypanosoma brucei gambiense DAL972]CBH10841.1 hypothetical protein, conserved [Trypanosoma brucei gambiense DAL972]|eukprot:XP_011773128.1 hypothetical protein, conserved [Trypanosoma brucei gambiense DAL972]
MELSFAFLLSTVVLIVFYAVDFFFARLLNVLKQDHLELDECSPEESPDLDPVLVVSSLQQTAVEMLEYQRRRFRMDEGKGLSVTPEIDPAPPTTVDVGCLSIAASPRRSENVVHVVVIICGLVGPFATVCQALFPNAFGWCRFNFPYFVQYIGAFSGVASVSVYTGRVWHCSSYSEVSRKQWLELMWFRLDFMCLTAVAAFLGAGSWVVTICLLAVGFYLAHRVMRIEKRIEALQLETQLVRGEIDVDRVFAPGTAEAARALGTSDRHGYDALA